jgi:formate--tetrahydrofolate ligase
MNEAPGPQPPGELAPGLRPIEEIAARLDLPAAALIPFGRHIAKIDTRSLAPPARPAGKLVLVTAITPLAAGEGKTTTAIGLGDALSRLGRRAAICLREPSLGPVFGRKGGATGGGRASVQPASAINLHFTGDFHAVASANNLLAAMIDNHLFWDNPLGLDPEAVAWRRAIDINDRALRRITVGLGGKGDGIPRADGFDITAASEVMAILCLSRDHDDLRRRLGDIAVGRTRGGAWVRARALKADGAMAALLADALLPNLVQTLEGTPALVHGGPFANIAHGCSSLAATRLALALAEIVVTEAGFATDLGAEKFCDIKCRVGGLAPDAAVLVCTLAALKANGGVAAADLAREDVAALTRGFANLRRHAENLDRFGLPVLVAVNRHAGDHAAELAELTRLCAGIGLGVVAADHFVRGGAGAEALAEALLGLLATRPARFRLLYPDAMPLPEKIRTVAREIYGAAGIEIASPAAAALERLAEDGFGRLPVCIAKTPYSLGVDPKLKGAPSGHTVPIREVRLAAGAGFVVALAGDTVTMPGLPRRPAAERIALDTMGRITGLD